MTTFKQIRQAYRLRSKWVKFLAPAGQHFDWCFALEGVAKHQIKKIEVALDDPHQYSVISNHDLPWLVEILNAEKSKLNLETVDGKRGFSLRIDAEDCFLIDGPERSERFLCRLSSLPRRRPTVRPSTQSPHRHRRQSTDLMAIQRLVVQRVESLPDRRCKLACDQRQGSSFGDVH